LNDGSSVFFTKGGCLIKLDSNGQELFSIGNFATYPDRLNISDAELIGNKIKVIGNKDTYNGFGYTTNSVQVMIDFDLNGNLLQTYVLNDGGTSPWARPTNIAKDNLGNYYITGYSYADGNYICKINSNDTVLWCKRFKHTNDNSIIRVNDIVPLANGDILLGGNFYDYSNSFGGLYLSRLSSSGDLLSAKTTTDYKSSIERISQLTNNDIILTGLMREDDQSFNKSFVMRMNSSETLSWLKMYNEGFGMSPPLVKNENDWYFTAFHFNNFSNNNPILFNTENTGNTICTNDNMSITFTYVPLFFTTPNLTIAPNSLLLNNPSALTPMYATQMQTYTDECIPRLLGVNEIKNKNEMAIYPNPSKGAVNIKSKSKIKSIEIMNGLGQKINNYYPNELEISILIKNEGLYLVKIETESGIKTSKVIISK